ncbi:hypothetical protein D1872_318620 [compost metagenome]
MSYAVHHQPLLWRNDTTSCANAQHELIGRLQLLLLPFITQIPIILHIAAVVLHQTIVILRDGTRQRVLQSLFQTSPQIEASALNVLHIAVRSILGVE